MPIVTLVSGGIDSLVMYKILRDQELEQLPLFIDYGQLSRQKEWMACKTAFGEAGFGMPHRIELAGYGKSIRSGITDRDKDVYKEAFLPGRNLMFLVVGASYAYYNDADGVAIGLLSEDTHLFPDQTEEFIVNANFAIDSALGAYLTILAPLMGFSKRDVIRLADEYRLPIRLTYSCHAGNDVYCGECISCQEIIASGRQESFTQFGERGD
ncbi:MAG: 7-cyano-7-deazaguanine synthase [bacterium]